MRGRVFRVVIKVLELFSVFPAVKWKLYIYMIEPGDSLSDLFSTFRLESYLSVDPG